MAGAYQLWGILAEDAHANLLRTQMIVRGLLVRIVSFAYLQGKEVHRRWLGLVWVS